MASFKTLRAILLPVIASCALVGGYAGMYMAGKNGAVASIKNSAGRPVDPYISGGVHPFKTTYTGVKAIDHQLLVLVPFFAYILDAPHTWGTTASLWYLLAHFFSAYALLSLEGLRRGNAGRIVSWTGTMGFICQNISYTITVPFYFILHIFTSPTASPSVTARDVLLDNPSDTNIVLLSEFIACLVPAVAMALPAPSVISPAAHYSWIAIWQGFPIWQSVLQWVFSRVAPGPARSARSGKAPNRSTFNTVTLYRVALFTTVTTHLGLLAVAVTPASAIPSGWPTLSAIFEQVTLDSALIPRSLSNPPTVDPKMISAHALAPLTQYFLQWDVYCGSLALLLWAVYLRRVAASGDRFSWTGLVGKVVGWTAVGGPVAAATVLLWERDEVLVRRGGTGGKKRL